MREIKFRAWDKINNKWHTDFFDVSLDLDHCRFYENGTGWVELNKEEMLKRFDLVEFTGLKDKNGKEMYRGDIVKISKGGLSGLAEIYWEEASVSKNNKGQYSDLDGFIKKGCWEQRVISGKSLAMYEGNFEVIGNIYEK